MTVLSTYFTIQQSV